MSDITILRARLRKRDKDIQQAVSNLKLEEGEMADIVRDGVRLKLVEMGVMGTRDRSPTSITPADAQLIAHELTIRLKEKGPKNEKEPQHHGGYRSS